MNATSSEQNSQAFECPEPSALLLYDTEQVEANKHPRTRERKRCKSCGQEYSHSAYYRHKRFCISNNANNKNKGEIASDRHSLSADDDDENDMYFVSSQSSSSTCFSLKSIEDQSDYQPLTMHNSAGTASYI